jgi:hypothetical protein
MWIGLSNSVRIAPLCGMVWIWASIWNDFYMEWPLCGIVSIWNHRYMEWPYMEWSLYGMASIWNGLYMEWPLYGMIWPLYGTARAQFAQ